MYLVTGADGFLGKHLCEYFEKHKIDYRASVRKKHKDPQFETGDLNTFSNWDSLFRNVDCIIHAAAKAHDMSQSPDLKNIYDRVNFRLTIKLAEEAKKQGVKRFIFISTIKVNGEYTDKRPFTPDDSPNPSDDYGISKHKAEIDLLKLHENHKFEVVILRPCLIYGKGVKANFKNLAELVQRGWPLPLASLNNKRSFVSVDNLIDLIIVCATHPNAAGQVFLVSDDHDLSLPELISSIAFALDKKIIIFPFPIIIFKIIFAIFGRSNFSQRLFGSLQVDISKTNKLLNWSPKYSTTETLKKSF
jgi:nucleoside-diphosphate-sugar epimerase